MSAYPPAAMKLKQAAEYCSLSEDLFRRVCPVRPIEFTDTAWGKRYLTKRLDEWLETLDSNPNGGSIHQFGEFAGED